MIIFDDYILYNFLILLKPKKQLTNSFKK
jgi:hypothetical protein